MKYIMLALVTIISLIVLLAVKITIYGNNDVINIARKQYWYNIELMAKKNNYNLKRFTIIYIIALFIYYVWSIAL